MTQTPSTRLRRLPARAQDRDAALAVLDEALVCHLGFVHDGHPVVTPTLHVRVGDRVYVHGSAASRTLRALGGTGLPACLTATLLDGIVLARAAFHHSVNYRSAMAFGTLEAVDEPGEKLAALEALTEKVVAGRWADARPPTRQELKATSVLGMTLDTISGKARTGPPNDDDADLAHPAWTGVVPLHTRRLAPVPDPALPAAIPLPDYLQGA